MKTQAKRKSTEENESQSEAQESTNLSKSSPKSPKKKIKLLPSSTEQLSPLQADQMVVRMNCSCGMDTSHNGMLMVSLPKEYLYYYISCPSKIVADVQSKDANNNARKGRNKKKTPECPYSFFEPNEVSFPEGSTFNIELNLYYVEGSSKAKPVPPTHPAIQACKFGAVFLPKESLTCIVEDHRNDLLDAVAFLPICVNRTKKSCGNKNTTKLVLEVVLTLESKKFNTQVLYDRIFLPMKKNSRSSAPQQQKIDWQKYAPKSSTENVSAEPCAIFNIPTSSDCQRPKSATLKSQQAGDINLKEPVLAKQDSATPSDLTTPASNFTEMLPLKYSMTQDLTNYLSTSLTIPSPLDTCTDDMLRQMDKTQQRNSQKLQAFCNEELYAPMQMENSNYLSGYELFCNS